MFTGSGNSWAAINDADSVRGKLWLVSVILTHSLIIQYIINIVTEWSVIQPHILWSATQIITRPVCHHESFQDWSEQTAVDRIECTWKKKKTKMRALAALSHREHSAAGKQRGWHRPTNSLWWWATWKGSKCTLPCPISPRQQPGLKSCMVRTTGTHATLYLKSSVTFMFICNNNMRVLNRNLSSCSRCSLRLTPKVPE